MKTMMALCAVALVGCAGNQALEARVVAAENENKHLAQQIEQIKADTDTCTSAMTMARNAEQAVADQANKLWEHTKAAAPGVKSSAMIEIDSIETTVKENATKALDAAQKWRIDHNL